MKNFKNQSYVGQIASMLGRGLPLHMVDMDSIAAGIPNSLLSSLVMMTEYRARRNPKLKLNYTLLTLNTVQIF